jgi:hypothetical protein
MIHLRDSNSYLKNIYESLDVVEKIQTLSIDKEDFYVEEIEFGVKKLTIGKSKNIEGYHTKILKIGEHILIPDIHNIFNLVVKKASLNPRLKASS